MNKEKELRIEIKLLNELILNGGNGLISKERVKRMIDSRVKELVYIDDLIKESMEDRRLHEFDLSTRLVNSLYRNEIETVGQLLKLWPLKPNRLINFGQKSMKEAELFLTQNRLI